MNLHAMLGRRAEDGRPVRVGLIGAGKFGTMYLSQAARTPGIHVMAIADLDPERARPWMLMAKVLDRAGKKGAEITELKVLVKLDQQNGAAAMRLVELLAEARDWRGVREYGQMAYFITPASARLHLLLARALEKKAPRRDLKRARWHLRTAELISPEHKGVAELKKKLGLK